MKFKIIKYIAVTLTTLILNGVLSEDVETCINESNEMCQTVTGNLSLTMFACDAILTIADHEEASEACKELERCPDLPEQWKCSVYGQLIDCKHCVRMEYFERYHHYLDGEDLPSTEKQESKSSIEAENLVIASANEIWTLVVCAFGFVGALVLFIRISRKDEINPVLPTAMLMFVSVAAGISMIIDICD